MNSTVAFIKLIRLPNLLIIALTQYVVRYAILYPFFIINSVELRMSDIDFFLLSLSTVMIAAAGYIINDYFDTKVDRVNRPDKIIVGKYIKRRVAMGAHIVISSIAILISTYVAYQIGSLKLVFIQILSVGVLWYYSVSFKKQVIIGNVVVAILAALVPLVAGLYEILLQQNFIDETSNTLIFYLEEGTSFDDVSYVLSQIFYNTFAWILGFSLFAFLSTMVREIVKDIEDYEGDKKYFSNTLAVVHGKDKAKKVAQLIIVIMMMLLGYLQYQQLITNDNTSFIYFMFGLQIPLGYLLYKLQLAKEKADYSKLSMNIKVVMLSGIMYAMVFGYTLLSNL
ncbi:MAG: geranylgeranylglycerol-phosphate geranylgeranyltransferase [Flavobacteriales bacterium]|nr:geranylgeranylglycerol-phosphate geranylgeranyltransferase [Flavobacteriales bacterium]MCB9175068.1 geranylgeranylglycerol-phosphate geranylgeranyltransferase [Flavobacteriales bacterium]